MLRLFPMFPAGRAGVGLVFLRVSTIAALLVGTYGEFGPSLHGRAAMVCWTLALPLGAGFATVLSAVGCCVAAIGLLLTTMGPQPGCLAVLALLSVSLALLGPGAYSADARLFGRRVLMFEDKPDPEDR
jgi:hypothetical protein